VAVDGEVGGVRSAPVRPRLRGRRLALPALSITDEVVDRRRVWISAASRPVEGAPRRRSPRVEARVEIIRATPGPVARVVRPERRGPRAAKTRSGAGSVALIEGQDKDAEKIERERAWRRGEVRVLICKPAIFGFGMNWQHCSQQLFLGLGDSFEQYYQAIRRCWRFGQKNPVDVRIVVSDVEGAIADNVKRKEEEANQMAESIVAAAREGRPGGAREPRGRTSRRPPRPTTGR
jgi:hypothetical protein